MNNDQLNNLVEIYLDSDGADINDIKDDFLERGENPSDIINRALLAVNKKEAELKLKQGEERQKKGQYILSKFKETSRGLNSIIK